MSSRRATRTQRQQPGKLLWLARLCRLRQASVLYFFTTIFMTAPVATAVAEPTTDELTEEVTNTPVATRKYFGLDFALFPNQAKTGNPFYSLSLTKSFKNADGEYEDRTISLLLRDWPVMRAYMDDLYHEGLDRTFADNRK